MSTPKAKTPDELAFEEIQREMKDQPVDPSPAPAPEPPAGTPLTALETLRVEGREPLRIWKAKGPKGVGGEISAVLCQDDNTIVMVHTLASGKFAIFTKRGAPQ